MPSIEPLSDARAKLEDFFNILSVEGKRNRRKGDDKHGQGNPADDRPIAAERSIRIHDWGMADSKEPRHEGPEKPSRPAEESQNQQDREKGERHGSLSLSP